MWWKPKQRPVVDRWLILVTGAYAVLAILLFPKFQYHLQNDSFAYLSLAATHTGNPYWGPMLPRLIAMFTALGISPLFAIRLPSILASVGLLILTGSSRKFLPLSRAVWNTLLLTLAVFLLTKTLDIATPDILLTFLLALMMRFAVERTLLGAILAGLSAGLGYLTKSVALPFFLLFSVLLLVRRLHSEPAKRKEALLSFGLSVFVCAFLIAPWIATISLRHGGFTIGESAHIIHATMNPLQDHEIPMNVRGLLAPPSGVALSVWDDPTTLEYHDWSPLSSGKNFMMQLKIIVINASRMIDVVFREFWLAWAILGGAMVYACGRKKDALTGWSRVTVAVWAMLLLMYLPIVTDDRYVWTGIVLLLATGALLLETVAEEFDWNGLQKKVALAVFFLAFTAYPGWRTLNAIDDGKRIAVDAVAAASVLKLQGSRTASDHWKLGLAFSYFSGAHYYGRPKNPADGDATAAELKAHGIDTYIVTGKAPEIRGFKEILTPAASVHILRSVSAR